MEVSWKGVIYILSSLTLLAGIGVFAFVSSRLVPAAAQTPTPTPRPEATIVVTPPTALPNQTIVMTGSNFTTGGGITIDSITIDDVPIPAAKINDGDRVVVGSAGEFIAVVIIPVNTRSLQDGLHAMVVKDSGGRSAGSTLTIPARTITVEPSVSRINTSVTVTGANFPITSPKAAADPASVINIEYEIVGIPTRGVATVIPDPAGKFTTSFMVPVNARIPSENNVIARVAGTAATATRTHSVPAASVTFNPASGPPGTRLTVTGSNFKAFDPVRSVIIGRVRVPPLSASYTNAEGSFSTIVVVPELDVGFQQAAVEVGELRTITIFEILPRPPPPPPSDSVDPAIALAPLGATLVRVWVFDAATEMWLLYDPASPALSDLKRLNRGDGFWINVTEDTKVTLGVGTYTLKKGWNLKGWLG